MRLNLTLNVSRQLIAARAAWAEAQTLPLWKQVAASLRALLNKK